MFANIPGVGLVLAAVLLSFPLRSAAQPQAPADSLTLADVYGLAAERNPRIAAAAAAADASATIVTSAGLPPDPVFQVGAMNLRLPGLEADMEASMAPSIQLMQMVPFPGKLGLSERIARGTSEMARANAEETAWLNRIPHATVDDYSKTPSQIADWIFDNIKTYEPETMQRWLDSHATSFSRSARWSAFLDSHFDFPSDQPGSVRVHKLGRA